jgi:type VI secretion system secreted protein Hcp
MTMAYDMFLKLDGIDGESNDKDYKDWIGVLAWSWGASNSGTFHVGRGGGGGKANVQDISCTKYVDLASPKLFENVFKGGHLTSGELVVRKAGNKPMVYMHIKMDNVLISSISTGGSGGEDQLTENLSLNFEKVEYQYVEQKADGTEGGKPMVKWDIAANAPK